MFIKSLFNISFITNLLVKKVMYAKKTTSFSKPYTSLIKTILNMLIEANTRVYTVWYEKPFC